MQNSTFSKSSPIPLVTRTMKLVLFGVIFLFSTQISMLNAQATLSVQGILKKSNGVAVDDGVYNITFKLYTVQAGGSAIWTEIQSGVEVSSGIYSTVLGNTTPLSVPFNQLYYLGVTIGSSELVPRIQLTSAPYALSLIGVSNQFPSSGLVKADSLTVGGGVLARGGAPGTNGINKNGYAFKGNSGDKDSGLFSTSDGKVSLYANDTEVLAATPGGVAVAGNASISGNVATNNLALANGGKVTYNGNADWRLVTNDDLTGGANGWSVYNPVVGQYIGWNNASSAGAAPIEGVATNFAGLYLYPTDNRQVLKKMYDLSGVGAFTQIKVKFRFHYIDSWGWGPNDRGWAAFADNASGGQMRVCWSDIPTLLESTVVFSTAEFVAANNYEGNGNGNADFSQAGEMVAFKSGNSFWVYFGGAVDQDTNDERFGVGMIEVWVK